jgi:hypothetical protein
MMKVGALKNLIFLQILLTTIKKIVNLRQLALFTSATLRTLVYYSVQCLSFIRFVVAQPFIRFVVAQPFIRFVVQDWLFRSSAANWRLLDHSKRHVSFFQLMRWPIGVG